MKTKAIVDPKNLIFGQDEPGKNISLMGIDQRFTSFFFNFKFDPVYLLKPHIQIRKYPVKMISKKTY